MAQPDDPGANLDGDIYSPEESDGRTDWPSTIAWVFLLGLVVVLFFLGMWWALAATDAHAAEQGPAGSTIPPFCKSYDQTIGFVTSPQYGEDLWRIKNAYFPSGKSAGVVEWTENRTTGTWTLLLSKGGLTCILFSGGQDGSPT